MQSLKKFSALALVCLLGAACGEPSKPACINSLLQIEGAKEQWALENKAATGSVPPDSEIAPYIKGSEMPRCPEGGVYTMGKIGENVTCSVAAHRIPERR
jgi:hypothetical protein